MNAATWKTKDGIIVKVMDMTDDHLVNSINFLIKNASAMLSAIQSGAIMQMCAEDQVERAFEMEPVDVLLQSPIRAMLYHAKKRELLDKIKWGEDGLSRDSIFEQIFQGGN